jgi:hypothetical protein
MWTAAGRRSRGPPPTIVYLFAGRLAVVLAVGLLAVTARLPFVGVGLDAAGAGVLLAEMAFLAGEAGVDRLGAADFTGAVFCGDPLLVLATAIFEAGTSPAMTFLNAAPADTRGAFLAFTRIASPVAGLRPLRALRAT